MLNDMDSFSCTNFVLMAGRRCRRLFSVEMLLILDKNRRADNQIACQRPITFTSRALLTSACLKNTWVRITLCRRKEQFFWQGISCYGPNNNYRAFWFPLGEESCVKLIFPSSFWICSSSELHRVQIHMFPPCFVLCSYCIAKGQLFLQCSWACRDIHWHSGFFLTENPGFLSELKSERRFMLIFWTNLRINNYWQSTNQMSVLISRKNLIHSDSQLILRQWMNALTAMQYRLYEHVNKTMALLGGMVFLSCCRTCRFSRKKIRCHTHFCVERKDEEHTNSYPECTCIQCWSLSWPIRYSLWSRQRRKCIRFLEATPSP